MKARTRGQRVNLTQPELPPNLRADTTVWGGPLQRRGAIRRGEGTSVCGPGGRKGTRGHLRSGERRDQTVAGHQAPAPLPPPCPRTFPARRPPPTPLHNAGRSHLGAAVRYRRIVGRRGGNVQVALLLGLPAGPREVPGARWRPRLLHVPLVRPGQPPPPTALA